MAEQDGCIYSDHSEHRASPDGTGGIKWESFDKNNRAWRPATYSQIPRTLRSRAEREFKVSATT